MNKLRKRMIGIVFGVSLFVFLLMSAIISSAFLMYNAYQFDRMTLAMSQNHGRVPEYKARVKIFNEESEFRTRYFIAFLEEDLVESINIDHIASVDETEAESMAVEVVEGGRTVGYLNEFRYRVVKTDEESYILFLDCSENFSLFRLVGTVTLAVSAFFTMLITIIFGALSKRVVRPFEENSKRQKQFITDASHELKTPLAIISANAEVLEYKNGRNDWTRNIVDQTKEMAKLINELLILSKLEEVGDELELERMDLAGLVEEKVEPFREVAAQKHASLSVKTPQQLSVAANREQMAQLVSILTENATKYVKDSGEIRVTLKKSGRFAVLEVYNTADIDPQKDYNRLFDRFYRTDKSRSSQTGGHGIGLSIARKIVTCHNGRITAYAEGDGICFKAEIAVNMKIAGGVRKKRV